METTKLFKTLLSENIINIDPNKEITFASGIKSIIYCDLRRILNLNELTKTLIIKFSKEEKIRNADIIVGTATAGIPWASMLAYELNKPCSYVRSKAKDHGTKSMVEGANVNGKHVALIEDMITTGESSIKAAKELIKEGAASVIIYSIFTYGFEFSKENFKKENIEFISLYNVHDLVAYLEEQKDSRSEPLLSWWNKTNR
ncbi:MAG: orotate phosphoribosyltransferase [Mycoplasma sp.]